MDPIVWAILLMLAGLGLVLLEIFIPSGGILGFLSVAALIGAIFLAFQSGGVGAGFAFIAIAMAGVPIMIFVALKYLPHTPIGRRLLLQVPDDEDVVPPEEDPRQLIGKFGTAKSAMLPGGAVTIDGRTYEAVSEGGAVDVGEPVEVTHVRNNRLVIRKAKSLPEAKPETEPKSPDDILSQPIDAVGLDPFDDPLS